MEIQKYSDKSFVVRGNDIYDFMKEFEEKGGLYNSKLNEKDGTKFAGMIFSLRREKSVKTLVDSLNRGEKLKEKMKIYISLLNTEEKEKFKNELLKMFS